jgi:hypothetical protein
MTFLQRLQAHKGGLVRLKTQLYWYDGVRNEIVGRICLLLDAAAAVGYHASAATVTTAAARRSAARTAEAYLGMSSTAVALLLIDGSPQWIWIAEQDVELL